MNRLIRFALALGATATIFGATCGRTRQYRMEAAVSEAWRELCNAMKTRDMPTIRKLSTENGRKALVARDTESNPLDVMARFARSVDKSEIAWERQSPTRVDGKIRPFDTVLVFKKEGDSWKLYGVLPGE